MARQSFKFASVSNAEQREQFVRLWKTHPTHCTRVRTHAIFLSGNHYEISAIAEILTVDRDSVSSWIDRYKIGGVDALLDPDKPGGPTALNDEKKRDEKAFKLLATSWPN